MRVLIAAAAWAAVVLVALGAPAAEAPSALSPFGAFSHWYEDAAGLQPSGADNAEAWRDVIGEDVFDTKGIAAHWSGGRLYLALVTNFPDANVVSVGRPVSPADLALDLDGDGELETGIVLSSIRETGDRGITRAPNIQRARAYRVTKWYRPSDILRTTYGQGWRWTGPDGTERQQSEIPVWVAEGEERRDLDVTVNWQRLPGSETTTETDRYAVLVTLAFHGNPGRLHNLPMVWGTAVCGNDVMFANASRLGDPGSLLVASAGPTGAQGNAPRWDNGPNIANPPAGTPAPIVLTSGTIPPYFGGGGGSGGGTSGTGSGGSGQTGNGGNAIGDLFGPGGGSSGTGGSGSGGRGTGGTGGGGTGGGGTGGGGSPDPGGEGLDIDPVMPVPVPSSITLMGLALGALGLLARCRRQRAA